jgi:hypothetical protein
MKATIHIILFVVLCLCTACSNAAEPAESNSRVQVLSPKPGLQPTKESTPTPMTISEYLLSILPNCDEVKVFEQPVKFDWPLIEQRIQELEGADWGYYGCPQPQEVVSTFYQEAMPKTPFLMTEINWVERPQGTLGVYYQSVAQTWLYLWVVPQPTDPQTSYVIVAASDTQEFVGGDCLSFPPNRIGPDGNNFLNERGTFYKRRSAE